MAIQATFVHTNLVAQDWETIARFYETVFGCIRIPPERHLTESWVERVTEIERAEIHGVHLRLPGYGDDGPTLEIFQYRPQETRSSKLLNQPGLAHIAFAVDDVDAARTAVLRAGGGIVGERITVEIPHAGKITFQYLSDPEGNIIEVQKWTSGHSA